MYKYCYSNEGAIYAKGLYWCTREEHQDDASILGSVNLRGTFRRISELWDNAHTLGFAQNLSS